MYGNLCEPWPVIWCGDTSDIEPSILDFAVEAASEILWSATGRRFGNCSVTLRPCRRDCPQLPTDFLFHDGILSRRTSWGWPFPTLLDGLWINLACGTCSGRCSCSSISEAVLPERVNRIREITVDGETLEEGVDWILYDGQRLIRVGDMWPRCQDWEVTGGPGAWTVEAEFGVDVPKLGQMANGALALEIAKWCEDKPCNLPPQVSRVTRQGVVHERQNVVDLLKEGLTGLHIPDMFIRRWNPLGIPDRARAYSPDVVNPSIQAMES